MKTFHDGKITLHAGDCLDVLKAMPENSIDAVVTDPPYHLTSIVKRFGAENAKPPLSSIQRRFAKNGAALSLKDGQPTPDQYGRLSKGFMGKVWDGGDIAFRPELWAEVLRVLKPGGHVVAFSGCRTYHRMAVAVEDAGFEIREMLSYIFGSGFPKSHSMREIGRPELGTALKPAHEPICLARKPLSESTVAANVLRWGTGALNIDATRIACGTEHMRGAVRGTDNGALADLRGTKDFVATDSPLGRWPANLCHDGSPEVLAGFPETAPSPSGMITQGGDHFSIGSDARTRGTKFQCHGDSGSAARFFYTAKADADDRLGSRHPTVKPVDLMQWLVRLVCPKGATVLDPFAGTGTTGAAAFIEGRRCVLIEREVEYLADIEKRMDMLLSGFEERSWKLAKPEPLEALPLFALTGD